MKSSHFSRVFKIPSGGLNFETPPNQQWFQKDYEVPTSHKDKIEMSSHLKTMFPLKIQLTPNICRQSIGLPRRNTLNILNHRIKLQTFFYHAPENRQKLKLRKCLPARQIILLAFPYHMKIYYLSFNIPKEECYFTGWDLILIIKPLA